MNDVQKKPFRISHWMVVAGLIGVVAIALFLYSQIATDPADKVSVVATGLRTAGDARIATGTLRNNTDHPYAHVSVDIDLLEADGDVVGRTAATTTNLGAGKTWSFEAPLAHKDAVGFRLKKLTCRRAATDVDPPEGDKPVCALEREIEVR